MAFGEPAIYPGLFGGGFEYPHSTFYDSDLSEMLRYYKQLVEAYEGILEKLREAQRDWQDSRDYVEKWNQKWSRDFIELRNLFNKTTAEMAKVQKELIERFETERAGMSHYMYDILNQIKDDNLDKLDKIKESNKEQIVEFEKIQTQYRSAMKEMLNIFGDEFKASLNLLDLNFKDTSKDLQLFISTEVNTLINLIKTLEISNEKYYEGMLGKYEDLLNQYDNKLKAAIKQTLNDVYGYVDNYTLKSDFLAAQENCRLEIHQLERRIEEVNQARVDIQAKKVLVMSPVTHKMKRIQWVLDEMWVFYQAWALNMQEIADLGLTVEEIKDWVCDKGLLPTHIGVTMLELAAMGKWIFLEKPDILAQLQGQIGDITYEALAENKEKITQEVITTSTSYFAGIPTKVELIEETLADATLTMKSNGNFAIGKG